MVMSSIICNERWHTARMHESSHSLKSLEVTTIIEEHIREWTIKTHHLLYKLLLFEMNKTLQSIKHVTQLAWFQISLLAQVHHLQHHLYTGPLIGQLGANPLQNSFDLAICRSVGRVVKHPFFSFREASHLTLSYNILKSNPR